MAGAASLDSRRTAWAARSWQSTTIATGAGDGAYDPGLLFRQLGDHLDFKVESRQPGHTRDRQGRMGCLAPMVGHVPPDFLERGLRVDHEHGDVNDILEAATGSSKDGVQVFKSQLHLFFQA